MLESFGASEIIASISALAAIGAVFYSKRSNSIAEESNKTAKAALEESKRSNSIAEESNETAKDALKGSKEQKFETFPHFELVSLIHNPIGFEQYTNAKGGKENYQQLTETMDLYKWVDGSRHTLSFGNHNGKKYLLINILSKEKYPSEIIEVYTGILELKYENYRREAKSFTIKKSRSELLEGSTIFLEEKDLPICIDREAGRQVINVNIAYAHGRGTPSIRTDRFYGYKAKGKIINFREEPNEAINAFGFKDSAFVVVVEDNSNIIQTQTVHTKMNDEGHIDVIIDDDALISKKLEN